MLKKQIMDYLAKEKNEGAIQIHTEEKEFAERNGLLDGIGTVLEDLSPEMRFADAYIERGNKETEEFIANDSFEFLGEPISYFKKHKNEFMYLESKWWDLIGVDAVSFENDDVFDTYDVMLGLKLQKKYGPDIKSFLNENLVGGETGYDLMFDSNEGIWSLNFALNGLNGYKEELTIGEAFSLIYGFLFRLADWVEKR